MGLKRFDKEANQIIIHTEGVVCSTGRELVHSEVFETIIKLYIEELIGYEDPILEIFDLDFKADEGVYSLINLLRLLVEIPLEQATRLLPGSQPYLDPQKRKALHEFVERLYDFWRGFDRFMVLHSDPGPSSFDSRPYRAFNVTIEALAHLVRKTYRDLCENIIGDHPRIYRQVASGCDVGLIAVPRPTSLPQDYGYTLGGVPFIRQVWLTPPMIIDPPMNKRSGQFRRVDQNPLEGLILTRDKWLCYPAQVGQVIVFVYFHERFIGLGCSLANLFELASDEQIAAGPEAIYVYGAPVESLSHFGDWPTVFYDDSANGLLIASVPGEDRFGYFGYLKKMILTLHNIVMMKRGRMPYHGAMVHITLQNGVSANVLLIGDTATGKSETLEALRILGRDHIRTLAIIADDMGSIEVTQANALLGYGTEIGGFIRLDDLQQGYAFKQIDRAIFMSPQKVNARVVLPVTTLALVLGGYPLNFILYANNYEEVSEDHPIIEQVISIEQALSIFREGAAMSKGTTTAKGLVHSYFANIFGPPAYKELHEKLAKATFEAAFASRIFVGQIRTRLGIPGCETKGPEEAARALLQVIENNSKGVI